jgi:hypothetical protein
MSKKQQQQQPGLSWKEEPDEHDFPAAADYLSLLLSDPGPAVDELSRSQTVQRKAKDLLRASRLPLLSPDDPEVSRDLRKVAKGEPLSPVLLVRGQALAGRALIVADGYHRICAAYHLDEDGDIPCRLVDLP